jgi:hypothetical protein
MKDSLKNGKLIESDPKTPSRKSINGVFMMRSEGESFEEFKENCINALKKQGLIKPKPPSEENIRKQEFENEKALDAALKRNYPHLQSE